MYNMLIILHLIIISFHLAKGLNNVIFAVNAGGESHIDAYGVKFEKDSNDVGIPSDYGKRFVIRRVPSSDQILYQTERYHHSSFGYDIPVHEDGDYVIVLKFSEVYFNSPDEKVFDVILNGGMTVLRNLDIFATVGRAIAHDEYIPFTVKDQMLTYKGQQTALKGERLRIDFVKGSKDNPKVNAIFVMKGTIQDVPKLPSLSKQEPEPEFKEPMPSPSSGSNRRPSGPKTPDPYENDQTSTLLPVFIAIGAALPLLFCICRL